eukprot:403347105
METLKYQRNNNLILEFDSMTKSHTDRSVYQTPNDRQFFSQDLPVIDETPQQKQFSQQYASQSQKTENEFADSQRITPKSLRSSQIQEHYNSVKGLICGFIAACSAGISLDFIKILLFYTDISVFELVYQRSLAALVLLTLILYFTGASPFEIDKQAMPYAFVRVVGSALGFVMMVFSIELIPISKTVVIVYNPFLASLTSYLTIGESMSKHDLICFFICTSGVVLLTDPMNSSISDFKEFVGIILAFLSSISFNLSYVALRKIKDRPVNSWLLVFYIMIINLVTMPAIFLSYDVYKNNFTHYSDKVWILITIIGILTLCTLYFTNLMFYYENAGRGAAYHNFELIFTYVFDVFYMKNSFKFSEMVGAWLIVMANIYLYVLKSLGTIE